MRHAHPHWRDSRGTPLDMDDDENAVQRFPPFRVRKRGGAHAPPALDLLFVRWGGDKEPEDCNTRRAGSWGASGSVVSATYAGHLLDFAYERPAPKSPRKPVSTVVSLRHPRRGRGVAATRPRG